MLKYVLWVVCVASSAGDDSFESLLDPSRRNDKKKELNFNQTLFPALPNYQVNARYVSEEDYQWIARVVHSRTINYPHVCTASCISERIFITAAKCIYSRVVSYTTVVYCQKRLPVIAFVVPSRPTKQRYDDIGFIVVNRTSFQSITWYRIKLLDHTNRTDNTYKWFSKIEKTFGVVNYKVVGYACQKGAHLLEEPDVDFNLTELNVIIGMDICRTIMTMKDRIDGFQVPCYHSCSLNDFYRDSSACTGYHGVVGGALFETTTNGLLGVATWGEYANVELPVGFSVPNSQNFYKDYECAMKIRSENAKNIVKGYYQNLCGVL